MSGIHLGFEVGTGKAIEIPLRHTAITGQTQESGKTTTLEGLLTRSKLRGLAYITKRGESSFHVMKSIPPYFRERTDWQFVAAILEATMSERLKFQRSWIMKLCQARHGKNEEWPAPRTLADVQRNVETALTKAKGMNESVYTELQEYLKMVVPQIDRLPYSPSLDLVQGVNVMDLTAYDFPLQALVVRSCIEWIKQHERNTVNVIPEAWKFAPKQRSSPVRLSAEELIREGGALNNFIWLDSQDIAGVADVLLRQIGVWIFGVQRAKHEIERTLDHIPEGLLAKRPRPADVATLGKGQFFACWGREMHKVYVQPAWMKAAHAEAIARGEEEVDSARTILDNYAEEHPVEKTASIEKPKQSPAPPPIEVKTEEVAMVTDAQRIERVRAVIAQNGPVAALDLLDVMILVRQYDELQSAHDALAAEKRNGMTVACGSALGSRPFMSGALAIPPGVDTNSLESVYAFVKTRAEKDPGILQLLQSRPEIRIKTTRTTIEADESTLRGMLALMISKKFFDSPQTGNTAFNDLKRRGKTVSKPNVYRELDKLAELGFVTKESSGYHVVAGMKVHIEEA